MLKRIRDLREDDDLTQEYIAKIVLNCTSILKEKEKFI